MKGCCTCRICRRTIRESIEWTFIGRPRWMGLYAIRNHGHLGWVPSRFYRVIVARMVRLGSRIESRPDPSDQKGFPRYFLARCMVPVPVLAERAKGGDS